MEREKGGGGRGREKGGGGRGRGREGEEGEVRGGEGRRREEEGEGTRREKGNGRQEGIIKGKVTCVCDMGRLMETQMNNMIVTMPVEKEEKAL